MADELEVKKTGTEVATNTLWQEKSGACVKDLHIKRFALGVIAAINIGVVAALVGYIIMYCPVNMPSKALLASPLIVGVISALAMLKIPLFGIDSTNVYNYSNPAWLLGMSIALVFFGPLIFTKEQIDWTYYHDPIKATRILTLLSEKNMEEIFQKFEWRLDNLEYYGVLPKPEATELRRIIKNYAPLYKLQQFLIQKKLPLTNFPEVEKKIKTIDEELAGLQKKIKVIPRPSIDLPDFEEPTKAQVKLMLHKYLLV